MECVLFFIQIRSEEESPQRDRAPRVTDLVFLRSYLRYNKMQPGRGTVAQRKRRIRISHLQLAIASLAFALASWAGFLYYTYRVPPSMPAYPLFFLLLFLAMTGTILPIALFIHGRRRRASSRRRTLWQPMRIALWIGLWVTLCIWLLFVQLLHWGTAILFLVIFGLIEWFIISRK